MNMKPTENREPKFSGEEVFRELTVAELDEVTGAGSLGKLLQSVISAPFKAVAAVA